VSAIVRLMTADDVVAASTAQANAFAALDRAEGLDPPEPTDAYWTRLRTRHHHFLTHDPGGAWVAQDEGRIVGIALALRRESLWGLSLLAVDPQAQSAGVGRRLLDASLSYADGCERAVILSSQDPRAMRSYATSGFDLFPQVEARGAPDRTAIPAGSRRVRTGKVEDAVLADSVDRDVRGAPRGPDHVRLATDMPMFVVDDSEGRGYAYLRDDGIVMALAATDDVSATALLWACMGAVADAGVPISIDHMTAEQQWAIRACYQARLVVAPSGPVFWRGATPPRPYLPNGAYL
jgi:GNAT superfamily N-acetyltransferase